MTTAKSNPESVKDIIKAAHLLLKPPGALPTTSTELRGRLNESWAYLSHRWDEELDAQPLDIDNSVRNIEDEADDVESNDAIGTSKDGERQIKILVGMRCLDLLLRLQAILSKEFWPAEFRQADPKDFLLGTADLRLIRLMLAQSLELLSTFSREYMSTLQHESNSGHPTNIETSSLRPVILALLSLLRPIQSPPSPSPGPSNTPTPSYLPPTNITQLLFATHLSPILLSSVLLGYTPTAPPPTYASIRRAFLQTLASLSPAQALSALNGTLSLLSPPRHSGPASISDDLTPTVYPKYIAPIIHQQLSAQILRPTGPRGLLLNLFGERALSNAESVDERKVEHAIQLLRRVPGGVEEDRYVRHVLRECLDFLAPAKGKEGSKGKDAPRAFRSVAAGVIGVWIQKPSVGEILGEAFGGVVGQGEMEENLTGLMTLDTLVGYTDPAYLPRVLEFTVRPLQPRLEQLAGLDTSVSAVAQGVAGDETEAADRVVELAKDILETWRRVMSNREFKAGS